MDVTWVDVGIIEDQGDHIGLEVLVDDGRMTYRDVYAILGDWLRDTDRHDWVVDPDMCRVGVGVTASGKGAGHVARFFASVSLDR